MMQEVMDLLDGTTNRENRKKQDDTTFPETKPD